MICQREYYLLAKCAAETAERQGLFKTSATLRDVANCILTATQSLDTPPTAETKRGKPTTNKAFLRFLH